MQIATAFGYEVVGVDIGAERLDFVKSLGARPGASAPDEALEVVQRRARRRRRQPHLLGQDGRLPARLRAAAASAASWCAVGLPATSEGNIEFNPFEFFAKDATIIYSAVGTVQDMRELVDLAAAGQGEEPRVAHRRAVASSATIFDELEAGKYLGRAVLTDLARLATRQWLGDSPCAR